jgi:hypothetical protein
MRFLQKHRGLDPSRHNEEIESIPSVIQKSWQHSVLPALLFFALSLLFCSPLLKELYSSGSGDWDYFMFLYEVPAITFFEYGQFPLWNPYCGGGLSLIGNLQAGYLSPIFIFTAFFGVAAGLKIAVLAHTFMGLWGMWLLSGHLKIAGPARFAPPIIFIFSGSYALHIAAGHIVWLPATLLPLFFLAFLRSLQNKRWLFLAAIIESIMFYEGGTYVFAFSLIFIFVYALVYAIQKRELNVLWSFARINLLTAALSAPKLLPALELLHNHPRPTGVGESVSWDVFLYFFIDRFTGLERSLNGTGWWAFGSYLGVIVIVLYLFSFTFFRKHSAIVIATLFVLLISLGNFSILSPWNILHQLPVFNGFQIPTRALIVFCFGVALLSGYSLMRLGRQNNSISRVLISLTVFIILCDLLSVSLPTVASASKTLTTPFWNNLRAELKIDDPELFRIPPKASAGLLQSVASIHQPFTQISIPFEKRNAHGAWSDQYLPLLQNRGVVDAYETIPFEKYALANTEEYYRGEYYLTGEGEVFLKEWSPNRQIFEINSIANNLLVINQNFDDGWKVSSGKVISLDGLLAINTLPGEYKLEVYYSPKSFQIGLYIFYITLGLLLINYTRTIAL